jgi:integration host factor subunit alpha
MTKADLVAAVLEKAGGSSHKDAADLVEGVVAIMKETLGRGEAVRVSGFGNFVPRDKAERTGRNPQSGAPLVIAGRRVLTFQVSGVLRDRMNGVDPGPVAGA